ncbi:MAG TPA: hypothetical protein VJH88_05080 [Candidatus Nanoarchaeia archaeon]|nr:hypothetical protein [Candidatus Nanoarchaeia archaeon]
MNVKNIQLKIQDRKAALVEFATALGSARKGIIEKKEQLSFPTIDAFRKLITEKRLELLHVIKLKHPQSVYELAKVVDRDLKSVATDIDILQELGLVSLERLSDERNRVKPYVVYDKINVEIAI